MQNHPTSGNKITYYGTLPEALEAMNAAAVLGLGVTLENYDEPVTGEPDTFEMQWRLTLAHHVPEHDPDADAVLVPPAPYSLPAIERGEDGEVTDLDNRILGLSHADSAAALLLIASRHPDLVGAALHRVAELTGGQA